MRHDLCVEFWKNENINELTNAAVMSKNLHYIKPDPKDISRRYFSDYKSASKFAKSIFEYGYHTNVIKE